MRASRSDARLRCYHFLVPIMAISQVARVKTMIRVDRRCACAFHAHVLYRRSCFHTHAVGAHALFMRTFLYPPKEKSQVKHNRTYAATRTLSCQVSANNCFAILCSRSLRDTLTFAAGMHAKRSIPVNLPGPNPLASLAPALQGVNTFLELRKPPCGGF